MSAQINNPQPAVPSGIMGAAVAAWVGLSPPIKSVITSMLLVGATAVTTWLVKVGIIDSADQAAVTGYIVTGGGIAIMAAIVWWKSYSNTKAAMIAAIPPNDLIKAVNDAPNGRKVVDASSPSPMVTTAKPLPTQATEPLK